nr:MAG TPA: hypothetical protein [Caudoviricetes sp.]
MISTILSLSPSLSCTINSRASKTLSISYFEYPVSLHNSFTISF